MDNVEITELVTPQRDWVPLFRDDDAWRRWWTDVEPYFDPDFVSRWHVLGASEETTGPDGFRETWLGLLEPWTHYWGGEIEELVDQGERVVLIGRQRATLADTRAEVELLGAVHFHFRAGRITELVFYAERNEGLAAAGLLGS